MTNTYSKMKALAAPRKPNSVDFSELLQHSRPHELLEPIKKTRSNLESFFKHDGDETNAERFGVVLGRSSSISSPSASTKGFRLERKQNIGPSAEGKYSAVKKVFSMRRSVSVSEKYCRIHDQFVTLTAYFDEEDCDDKGMEVPTTPVKKERKRGNILKACKRFFGLK